MKNKRVLIAPANVHHFSEVRDEFRKYYDDYFGDEQKSLRLKTILDIVFCYFRYGCWINNYFEYRFWEKSGKERDTFVTWKRAVHFIEEVNGKGRQKEFAQKDYFLRSYGEFIDRDWIYPSNSTKEELVNFLRKHPIIIEKPNRGGLGKGVSRKNSDAIENIDEYYGYLRENDMLLEECIKECREMSQFHPNSLNTLRVVTLVNEAGTDVRVIAAVLRMGNNNSEIDNARASGLFAAVNESGEIISEGVDFAGNRYTVHPYTGQQIVGSLIPYFDEIIRTCKKAAFINPNVRFVGWDTVVREGIDGYYVEIIEGNDRAGVPTLQVPEQKGIYKLLCDE